jgi:hypothetical protein
MGNVQNCDSYINIASSQTYKSYSLDRRCISNFIYILRVFLENKSMKKDDYFMTSNCVSCMKKVLNYSKNPVITASLIFLDGVF